MATYSATQTSPTANGYIGAYVKITVTIIKLDGSGVPVSAAGDFIKIGPNQGNIVTTEQDLFPITAIPTGPNIINTVDLYVKFRQSTNRSFSLVTGVAGNIAVSGNISVTNVISVNVTHTQIPSAILAEVAGNVRAAYDFTVISTVGSTPVQDAFINVTAMSADQDTAFYNGVTLTDAAGQAVATVTSDAQHSFLYIGTDANGKASLVIAPKSTNVTWANLSYTNEDEDVIRLNQVVIYNNNRTANRSVMPVIDFDSPSGQINLDDIPGPTVRTTIPSSSIKSGANSIYYLLNDKKIQIPSSSNKNTLTIVEVPKSSFSAGAIGSPKSNRLKYICVSTSEVVNLSLSSRLDVVGTGNAPGPNIPVPNGIYLAPYIFNEPPNIQLGRGANTPLTCNFEAGSPDFSALPDAPIIRMTIFINAFSPSNVPGIPNTPVQRTQVLPDRPLTAAESTSNPGSFSISYDPNIFLGLTSFDTNGERTGTIIFQYQNLKTNNFSLPRVYKIS